MSKNYWQLREIKEKERLLNTAINETEKELVKEYRRLSAKLVNDMKSVYTEIMNKTANKEAVAANDIYTYVRYYEMLNDINSKLQHTGIRVNEIFERRFHSLYKENCMLVGKHFNISTEVNEDLAKRVINGIWVNDGKNWSERIWDNQLLLAEKLENQLINCLSAGYSPELFKEAIMTTFNTGYNQASRIARTELAHIQIASTIDKYREAGVKKYRFLATPDERECSQCQELDGKIFRLDDIKIPLHPNCRCATLAVLGKED